MNTLQQLLLAQSEANLEADKEAILSWLLQSFNQKDITEVVRRVSYESFKMKSKGKKTKDIDFSSITFFSLSELPELYEYFMMRLSMTESILRIKGDGTIISLEAKGCFIEQRQFNAGSESTINVGSVLMNFMEESSHKSEIVCYGKSEKQDLVSISIRKEKKRKSIVGRLLRINVKNLYSVFLQIGDSFAA